MRSCLNCDARNICIVSNALLKAQRKYVLAEFVPFKMFDNLEEIYRVVAKTCKRWREERPSQEKTDK